MALAQATAVAVLHFLTKQSFLDTSCKLHGYELIYMFIMRLQIEPSLLSKLFIYNTSVIQHKTLLHVAAERGDAEAVRIIIAAGADTNLR